MEICIHVFYYACFAYGDGISKQLLNYMNKATLLLSQLHYAYYLEYSIPYLSWQQKLSCTRQPLEKTADRRQARKCPLTPAIWLERALQQSTTQTIKEWKEATSIVYIHLLLFDKSFRRNASEECTFPITSLLKHYIRRSEKRERELLQVICIEGRGGVRPHADEMSLHMDKV